MRYASYCGYPQTNLQCECTTLHSKQMSGIIANVLYLHLLTHRLQTGLMEHFSRSNDKWRYVWAAKRWTYVCNNSIIWFWWCGVPNEDAILQENRIFLCFNSNILDFKGRITFIQTVINAIWISACYEDEWA